MEKMKQPVVRQDDFDFRMDSSDYIANHEEFIKLGITETAVVQFCTDNRLKNFDPKLIEYMNTAPCWDVQFHGWSHDEYDKMSYDEIVRDLSASFFHFWRLFKKLPTLWMTPWNRESPDMHRAASFFGMKIYNESWDIARFIRENKAGTYNGTSVYYHLWSKNEAALVPEMLKIISEMKDK